MKAKTLLAILLVIAIFIGVPYVLWGSLNPVGFWQRGTFLIATVVYEWFAFWIGVIIVAKS